MTTATRRYDIDWLRVIAIALLLIFHIAIVFQPWGALIGFIQNSETWVNLWIPMSMLNVWRIPLLFFISGMGVCFAMRKRNWKQLLTERTKRILVPFVFGVFFIVPLHWAIWQNYYNQEVTYMLTRSHLWFLGNIFAYVIFLLPLFYFLKKHKAGKISYRVSKFFSNPLSLLVVIIPFVLEAVLVKPELFTLYAMNWHGFFIGLLAFLFGYLFVYSGDAFWNTVYKWKWALLVVSATMFTIRWQYFNLEGPGYLMATESNLWIFTIFGFARYLNRPSKALNYLTKAAYPVYIVHMLFLYLSSIAILPLEISPVAKFLLMILATNFGCYAIYELLIRRVGFIGMFFGLNYKPAKVKPVESEKAELRLNPVAEVANYKNDLRSMLK
jgi:glucan biosynthesis protein C